MFNVNITDSIKKLTITGLAVTTLLAGCNSASNTSSETQTNSSYEVAGDHAVGNPDAPVTVVEYASVTCGHCANWHMTVYPEFKKKYVDTGKVRYIFREFPTPPENLARAGFMIANCAGEGKFLDNIAIQFKRQRALLSAQNRAKAYVDLAKASGLSEAEYKACVVDPGQNERYEKVVDGGITAGVTGTPSFFINGEIKKVFKLEEFDKAIAPILGEPLSEQPSETIAPAETAKATSDH